MSEIRSKIKPNNLRPQPTKVLKGSKTSTTGLSKSVEQQPAKLQDGLPARSNKPGTSLQAKVNKDKTVVDLSVKTVHRKPSQVLKDGKSTLESKPKSTRPQVASSTPPVNTKNIMNLVHNVTIVSPTLKRKEIPEVLPQSPPAMEFLQKARNRTRTRTIDPEESVMQRILQLKNPKPVAKEIESKPHIPTPSPIAFEISLDATVNSERDDENEYEDDFESYESDFESEPSEDQDPSAEESEAKEEQEETDLNRREEERKLDSGNYDLPSVSKDRPFLKEIQELVEPKTVSVGKRNLSIRQINAMKSLSPDTMTFHLFEQKPMEYDRFMRVFGHLSSCQAGVQTKFDDVCNEEMQTDDIETCSRWTQNPPEFSQRQVIPKSSTTYKEEALGVGFGRAEEAVKKDWSQMASHETMDYERLNLFLKSSSVTIGQIIESQSAKKDNKDLRIKIDAPYLKDYQLRKTFGFAKVIVVAYGMELQKGPDIVEVYNSSYLKEPQSILTSWSKITSVLIHSKWPSYIFGGTSDGCINLWNWMGCSSNPSQDESLFRQRPAMSTIVPEFLRNFGDYCTLVKIVEITTDNNYSISGEDVAALYTPGIIVIWSIETIRGKVLLKEVKTIELTTKSVLCKGIKTKFEKNVTYFESNIFSDAALKELQTIKSEVDQSHNLLFIDLIFDGEDLVSISNQSFITVTTVGLTNETRKIHVTNSLEGSAIKITAAALLSPKVILIGLSDGTLQIKCITQRISSTGSESQDIESNDEEKKNHELVADKSCAIQNIVLNERKLYEALQTKINLDSIEAKDSIKEFLQVPDDRQEHTDRILVHGHYFKRSGVKDIQVVDNSIYFLDKQELKLFDLISNREEKVEMEVHAARGVTVSKDHGGEYLVVNGLNFIRLFKVCQSI